MKNLPLEKEIGGCPGAPSYSCTSDADCSKRTGGVWECLDSCCTLMTGDEPDKVRMKKDMIRKIIREAIREMNEDIVGGPTKTRDDCSCWDFCGNACSDEWFAAACQVTCWLQCKIDGCFNFITGRVACTEPTGGCPPERPYWDSVNCMCIKDEESYQLMTRNTQYNPTPFGGKSDCACETDEDCQTRWGSEHACDGCQCYRTDIDVDQEPR